MDSCFLCNPNRDWIYAQDDAFFAMLGLGPIVEGYSLLATISHTPSMMDLSSSEAEHLSDFTHQVRALLKPHYGDAIITEHGRVAPCIDRDRDKQESHCFHAHRLVFPVPLDLAGYLNDYGLDVFEYSSFIDCHRNFTWKGEYLYYERPDESCLIAAAPMRLVRQFFRYKVADSVGHPELANWKDFPLHRVVETAKRHLIPSGD
jgi:hypothetical protein